MYVQGVRGVGGVMGLLAEVPCEASQQLPARCWFMYIHAIETR